MLIPDEKFFVHGKILDVGGWFKPEPRATHVIDLMPWETRGARLNLSPIPGERFDKSTWYQANFLQPDFRLPFESKTFDLVVCGHTVEDLEDPGPLLKEMQRVGKGGIIECPSRTAEQTKGIADRETNAVGYFHHHWIVEAEAGDLVFYSKKDSLLEHVGHHLPLRFFEHLKPTVERSVMHFEWTNDFEFRFERGRGCAERGASFVASMNVPTTDRLIDTALRLARRTRSHLRDGRHDPNWWSKIVETSQPYSSIPLK